MENHYFECSCFNDEHMLKFTFDPEDGELYLSTFLDSDRRWYRRAWVALKYLFGYKCRYGHFSNTNLNQEEIRRLIALLNRAVGAPNA